jgi:hypothetical protein
MQRATAEVEKPPLKPGQQGRRGDGAGIELRPPKADFLDSPILRPGLPKIVNDQSSANGGRGESGFWPPASVCDNVNRRWAAPRLRTAWLADFPGLLAYRGLLAGEQNIRAIGDICRSHCEHEPHCSLCANLINPDHLRLADVPVDPLKRLYNIAALIAECRIDRRRELRE